MPRSMIRKLFLLSFAAVLAAAVGGCGAETATTPTATATTTQSFDGTLVQSGAGTHSFTVSVGGSVTISLTSVAPLATMGLGVGIATWDGTSCGSSIAQNDSARSGATALTGTAASGSYCVRVYDSGNIPSDWTVSYTVQVVHP